MAFSSISVDLILVRSGNDAATAGEFMLNFGGIVNLKGWRGKILTLGEDKGSIIRDNYTHYATIEARLGGL